MLSHDDPRFTALALGEMTPEERALFEAELAKEDGAADEARAFDEAAALLREELTKNAPISLTAEQQARVDEALRARQSKAPAANDQTAGDAEKSNVVELAKKREAKRKLGGFLGAAATLAVAAAALGVFTMRSGDKASESAAENRNVASSARPNASAASPKQANAPAAMATATSMPMATAAASAASPGVLESKAKRDIDEPKPGPGIPAPEALPENPFVLTAKDKQSTFSIDVDTASYAMMRGQITSGLLPGAGLVRIEEMVNYFKYSYPNPDDAAFGFTADAGEAPWSKTNRLVRIGIKGKEISLKDRPASNLVFLIDVSGSMHSEDKIGLLKKGFSMLVEQLDERDTVSIVTYAGNSGVVLEPTKGNQRSTILGALDRLQAGGGTNGGQGIQAAYSLAARGFIDGGTNRVILATDGDFNVGITSQTELQSLIEEKAKTGVFLSVLGFGRGNTNDRTMETLADKGNGNYAYLDSEAEAKRVLVSEGSGTLLTIAKDVKIQVTWNPEAVKSFRLIGYENRALAHSDFTDDTKDAGEIGAGHTVTALYEIVPVSATSAGKEFGKLAIRFKDPDGTTSRLVEGAIPGADTKFDDMSTDYRFASGVAAFGMILRNSAHKGSLTFEDVEGIAKNAIGDDADGHRKEFVSLVSRAATIKR